VKQRQSELQDAQQQERASLKSSITDMEEGLKVMQQKVMELLAARHEKQLVCFFLGRQRERTRAEERS
jgi:hypothetical protein